MKKIFSLFITVLIFTGCTNEDYEALNSDPNNPTDVDAGQLFVSATKSLFDLVEETNVNVNNTRLFSQYWTETTYTDEANYEMINRGIPENHWNRIYQNVLFDLQDAKARSTGDNMKIGQAEVLEVYAWSLLVDVFGDVPYSQALKVGEGEYLPAYDDAAGIYDDLLARLDSAISALGSGGTGFGNSDLVYGNDGASWVKFAKSLKVKLGMRLSHVSPAKAKAAVESAASGAFTSNADNATLSYEGSTPNTNPIWVALVQSGRNDFVPANTIVDMLQDSLADPRQDVFFDPSTKFAGKYKGGTYAASSTWASHSHIGTKMFEPSFRGVLLDFAEVSFNLAEAAALGFSVPGDAPTHYANGITANFADWGVADVATYLAKPEVAWATAAGTDMVKIARQYWIAMYNRGFEGWYVYRKFDAPQMNLAATSLLKVPKRYTYPASEQTLNGSNWTAAASAIGGDEQQTKIFWDVNDPPKQFGEN